MNRLTITLLLPVIFLLILSACDDGVTNPDIDPDDPVLQDVNTVEVRASHNQQENLHLFELSTDEIASGFVTFEFENASGADHFFLLYKMPDAAQIAAEEAGESLMEHWFNGVTVPFQEEYLPYAQGERSWGDFVDNLVASVFEKAPWFFDPGAIPMGGPGLTAPGLTSETMVELTPGTYLVECYVKDGNEEFHSFNGMLAMLTVTEERADISAPETSVEVTIAQPDAGGLSFTGDITAGEQIIAVNFEEQPEFGYEHLLGHNVQLVKLDDKNDEALLEALSLWIDWSVPGSFIFRAPEGASFMGGAMEMPGGHTAYLHVDLSPGDYAWIAEVPDASGKGMLKTFTVE